jgi:hypothetical protein
MNSVARFFIEFAESRRIEHGLKRKLGDLEDKRLHHSPAELKKEMEELDNIAWQANGFNKGLLFVDCKMPYAVHFINMREYKPRIDSLKQNLGY